MTGFLQRMVSRAQAADGIAPGAARPQPMTRFAPPVAAELEGEPLVAGLAPAPVAPLESISRFTEAVREPARALESLEVPPGRSDDGRRAQLPEAPPRPVTIPVPETTPMPPAHDRPAEPVVSARPPAPAPREPDVPPRPVADPVATLRSGLAELGVALPPPRSEVEPAADPVARLAANWSADPAPRRRAQGGPPTGALSPPVEDPVTVTIGRVEIRARVGGAAPESAPRATVSTLDDYLRRRARGRE